MSDDGLPEVATAHRALATARADLQAAVDRARSRGTSWAAIGATLDMTRQAAFKRFGRPRDPRTGDTMTPTDLTTLPALTERAFALLDAGDHVALRGLMTEQTAEALTPDLLLDTWSQVVAESGNLARCRDTGLESFEGAVLDPSEPSLGGAVGHTTIECEVGEWWGRVAFDPDQRIIGLLVVPVDTTDLPF
ncbi:hypothetical protein [Nocardioides currus]|uniref:DUF3887 domain-containing protein n=1 Tax=Nocardioides currus TaxID=2133958 RepID=A0A2R7YSM9_9ACTN|nr:hypothetical protein [Nocardioides currus]PUA79415.1 hypothetical protein C7S10_18730 [Nocardioides currus]